MQHCTTDDALAEVVAQPLQMLRIADAGFHAKLRHDEGIEEAVGLQCRPDFYTLLCVTRYVAVRMDGR